MMILIDEFYGMYNLLNLERNCHVMEICNQREQAEIAKLSESYKLIKYIDLET